MSLWSDRLENHPLHAILAQIVELLDRAEAIGVSVDALEHFERIRNAVNAVLSALKAADPELVNGEMLDSTYSSATSIEAELQAFLSDQDLNHLTAADSPVRGRRALQPLARALRASRGSG